MTIAELGAIGELVGSIGVIITLMYLAAQIRQSNVQQKREEVLAVQNGQNRLLAQADPPLVRALALMAADDPGLSVADRARAIMWMFQYLNHFEIVFDLHRIGSLDDERYSHWEDIVIGMLSSAGWRAWWNGSGNGAFRPALRARIDHQLGSAAQSRVPIFDVWPILQAATWQDVEL